MLPRPLYQAMLLLLTLAAVTGGLWLAVAPHRSPGLLITIPPTPTAVLQEANQAPLTPTVSPSLLRVNINTASAQELAQALPGIGDVLAARIVAYRELHGPFARTDQLMAVRGIGPTLYERIRTLVAVGE